MTNTLITAAWFKRWAEERAYKLLGVKDMPRQEKGPSLVGKTLTGLKIAKDKEALLFQTTDGDYVVRVDGDCCSHSWIENVEMPALGFPAKITAIENLDLNKDAVTNDEYECLQFYGAKVVTDRGEIVIDYRNSSNGYYGGNIVWPEDDYFYGGVFGQNVSKEEWQDL